MTYKRSKHIDTKYHFIREEVDDSTVQLVYTPTYQLAADLLTKSFPQVKVGKHRKQLLGQFQILPRKDAKFWVGCWRWEFRISWAKKIENFSFSSWKLRRNKLTCDRKLDVNFSALFLWHCQKRWTLSNMNQVFGKTNLLYLHSISRCYNW